MFWKHRRDLLEARDREAAALRMVIDVLSEQIDYLRMVMGQPNLTRQRSMLPTEEQMPELVEGLKAYMTEEEEDIIALHEGGHISELEMEEQLAAAGLRHTKVTLA